MAISVALPPGHSATRETEAPAPAPARPDFELKVRNDPGPRGGQPERGGGIVAARSASEAGGSENPGFLSPSPAARGPPETGRLYLQILRQRAGPAARAPLSRVLNARGSGASAFARIVAMTKNHYGRLLLNDYREPSTEISASKLYII